MVQLINEPTAAAIAYGLDKDKEGRILVSDFGGGTWDVTILDIRDNDFKVVGTDGDCSLGGSDIDLVLANHAATRFRESTGIELSSETDLPGWYDLLDRVQKAKRDLSTAESTTFVLSAQGGRLAIDLTRAELNDVIKPLLDRGRGLVERCLTAAGLAWSDIDEVLAVGGSSSGFPQSIRC